MQEIDTSNRVRPINLINKHILFMIELGLVHLYLEALNCSEKKDIEIEIKLFLRLLSIYIIGLTFITFLLIVAISFRCKISMFSASRGYKIILDHVIEVYIVG